MVKLQRAYGGCLGKEGRRRTWLPAIRFGELETSYDPEISEWGNPVCVMADHPSLDGGAPGELKHLSNRRKRKQ